MRIGFHLRKAASMTLLLLCGGARAGHASRLDDELHCDARLAENPLLANAADRLAAGSYRDISVSGLSRIDVARVWDLLGGQQRDLQVRLRAEGIDGDSAAVLLARALESQLFARASIARAPQENSAGLILSVEEHPYVLQLGLDASTPLHQVSPSQLIAAFLGAPNRFADAQTEAQLEPISSLSFRVWRKRMDAPLAQPGCQRAPPPEDLFARLDAEGNFVPGILRGGLRLAELRALRWLQDRGYPHATIHASVADGVLTLSADEGVLRRLETPGSIPR